VVRALEEGEAIWSIADCIAERQCLRFSTTYGIGFLLGKTVSHLAFLFFLSCFSFQSQHQSHNAMVWQLQEFGCQSVLDFLSHTV